LPRVSFTSPESCASRSRVVDDAVRLHRAGQDVTRTSAFRLDAGQPRAPATAGLDRLELQGHTAATQLLAGTHQRTPPRATTRR